MKKSAWSAILIMAACMCSITYIPKSSNSWWSVALLIVWIASFFWLLKEANKLQHESITTQNTNLRLLIYGGILLRVLLLAALPKWSSDLYRILWDAKVQAIGFNPYSVTPKELMDRGLNTFSNAGNIYHQLRDVHAYSTNGPLYEWIAFLAVKLSLGKDWIMTFVFRLIILMLDVLSILSLLRWQQEAKINLRSLVHYLFNPFILFSIALYAPAWTLAFALLIFAFQLYQQNRMLRSGIVYVLALAASPLAIIALPILLIKSSRKTILKSSLVISILSVAIYLPYFRTGDVRHNFIAEWMHDLLFYPGGGVLQGFSFINPIYPTIGLIIAILAWKFIYIRTLFVNRKEHIERIALLTFENTLKWALLLPGALLVAWILEAWI